MELFDKLFVAGSHKRWWFCFTLCPALLPIVVSVIIALDTEPLPSDIGKWVRMTDVIFGGLAVNIGNFGLVTRKVDSEVKLQVIIVTTFLVIFSSICLKSAYDEGAMSPAMRLAGIFTTSLSIILNYSISKRFFYS